MSVRGNGDHVMGLNNGVIDLILKLNPRWREIEIMMMRMSGLSALCISPASSGSIRVHHYVSHYHDYQRLDLWKLLERFGKHNMSDRDEIFGVVLGSEGLDLKIILLATQGRSM